MENIELCVVKNPSAVPNSIEGGLNEIPPQNNPNSTPVRDRQTPKLTGGAMQLAALHPKKLNVYRYNVALWGWYLVYFGF